MSASNLPILYSFRRCPYAMRARLALHAAQYACELREVELRSKPAQLLQVSPKGTVPVLVLPDGRVLEQSLDIMQHALRWHDPLDWLPSGPEASTQQAALIARNDTLFKQALDRYKYPGRFGLSDNQEARRQGAAVLAQLDALLRPQPFLAGAHFGLADAAIAPFVRQWAHVDLEDFAQQPWRALQVWLQSFESSPRFLQIMDKYAAWQPGQAPQVFPGTAT